MNSETVVFLSNWFTNNPYKRFLIQKLQAQGIQIELKQCTVFFVPTVLQSGIPKALHFHVLHSFLLARNPVTQFLKFVFFITQLLTLKLLGIRLIWTVHEWADKIRSDRQNIPPLYAAVIGRCLDAVICHCLSTQRTIEQAMNLARDCKVQVIPHGHYIDAYPNHISQINARKKLDISSKSTVFLLFGSIYRYKGVIETIDAFKALQETDQEVILLISGNLKEADLQEEINKRIMGCKNIRFIDQRIPEEEVQVHMNASDCVLTPYRTFTTSGVAVLVMSFARACIAPNVGFFEDILDEDGSILYDFDSPTGLQEAMEIALDAKSKLFEMGQHNLEIAQKWDWETIAGKTFSLY